MKKLHAVLISTLFIFIFSCKKNDAVNLVPDPQIINKDTPVLLTHLVVLDTAFAAPFDTTGQYDITYDSAYRPTSLTYRDYSNTNIVVYTSILIYEYSGSDTVVTRTTKTGTTVINGSTTVTHDTMYYEYLTGKRSRDSLRGNDGAYYERLNYAYFPDHIAADYFFSGMAPSNDRYGQIVFYQNQNGGNLVHQADTSVINYISSGLPAIQTVIDEYTFSYLSNPDPYYRVIKPMGSLYFNDADWLPGGQYASAHLPSMFLHNYFQSNTAGTGGSSSAQTTGEYNYTFRGDGYPIELRMIQPGISYNQYYKLQYYYNK